MDNSSQETLTQDAQTGDPGKLPAQHAGSEELFQIIDETGEGFGFDITPETLAKPLAIGTGVIFSVGMLAGIPFGLALGRSDDSAKGVKGARVRPTMAGVKFAASSFGLGTLLCTAFGITSFYAIKNYYDVETFEEFGEVMRRAVPARRSEIESGLSPILDVVRRNAGDNLPEPARRMREHFAQTRIGRWIKRNIDLSAVVETDSNVTSDESPEPSSG